MTLIHFESRMNLQTEHQKLLNEYTAYVNNQFLATIPHSLNTSIQCYHRKTFGESVY